MIDKVAPGPVFVAGGIGGGRQMAAVREAMARSNRYPAKSQAVAFSPVGQIVGTMDKVRRSADVLLTMVEECIESLQRGNSFLEMH